MSVDLRLGDCLEAMRVMPDASVDSIVTDPPYGLSFMGKKWDYDVPGVDVWAECLRVLKPGGHLLAFAGTRTQHRMAVRIEDAGFEIRDMIAWVYGSGFPKSLDVSKAIDKAGGSSPREQADMLRLRREAAGLTREQVAEHCGCTPSSVRDWEEGRARASGAPIEFIVPSAEYRAKLANLLGYSADERRLIGKTSDRRGDGTVYGVGHSGELREGGITEAARQWQGWGTALKPALEPITVARKPLVGTVAANVLEHGTGALNVDGCRVGDGGQLSWTKPRGIGYMGGGSDAGTVAATESAKGRWPANLIHDGSEEVLAGFPVTGAAKSGVRDPNGSMGYHGGASGLPGVVSGYDDNGGSAARFFYCAKASKRDRDEGLEGLEAKPANSAYGDGLNTATKVRTEEQAESGVSRDLRRNTHPTVKPTDLMRYLCRLVTPPGGVVLDPFMGSGSTGKAAVGEGFRFVGCEMSPEYMAIAKVRIQRALEQFLGDLA